MPQITKDKALELIHAKIHGLRMIPRYKPSMFESDVAKLVSEVYKEDCTECSENLEIRKLEKEMNKIKPKQNNSVFGGLFNG